MRKNFRRWGLCLGAAFFMLLTVWPVGLCGNVGLAAEYTLTAGQSGAQEKLLSNSL